MSFPQCLPLRRIAGWIFAATLTVSFLGEATALDPNRLMSQYVRQEWSATNGWPSGSVSAIQQTPDGYLWIGTDKGLIRFDGFTFLPFSFLSKEDSSATSAVLGLVADSRGRLWIQRQGAGVLRYDGQSFEGNPSLINRVSSQVTAISRDNYGGVLLADVTGGILRLQADGWQKVGAPERLVGSTAVISLAEAPDGRIWLGTLGTGVSVFANGMNKNVSEGLPERKINCLLSGAKNELWAGTDNGLYRWAGSSFEKVRLSGSFAKAQILTLLRDRDANLWVGTSEGLVRLNAAGAVTSEEERDLRGSGGINALFEDREGNLWVGGERGLLRIRNSAFITYSSADGLPLARPGPIFVDPGNRVWIASTDGGLYTLENEQVRPFESSTLGNDVVYSIAGGNGDIWLGRRRGGITRLQFRNGTFSSRTYTVADGLAQDSVYKVFVSRDGTVWAGTLSEGVSRFKEGRFLTYGIKDGLAASTVSSILESRDGTMWFGTSGGLSSLSDGRWRTYRKSDGLPSENVNCLFNDSEGNLWIGTAAGLAVLRDGASQSIPDLPAVLRDPIFGIAEDKRGSLWISTSSHVLQLVREPGKSAFAAVRDYGVADGLSSSEGVNRSRSVVADSSGKIWFSLNNGVSFVDPSHLPDSSFPAIPHVEGVLADGNPIGMGDSVRIPPAQKRITFRYTGISLAMPERVRFRYRVDDFDRNWSETVAAREAVYTNLGPGTYRFRVTASNGDGVWSGQESVLAFHVNPALWQTWWFRSAMAMFVAFAIFLFYRFRLHQLTSELNIRFEERLAERTRIAQELHDTLLQGFLSASMQLHVAEDRLPENSPAKPMVTRVLELMKNVTQESRNVVHGLRSPSEIQRDLDEAFSKVPEELGSKQDVDFRVIVEGQPRPLNPLIRDDVYRMGREALVNAFHHSGAGHIRLELEYRSTHLRLVIRDDGRGIDEQVLHSGRAGHWGLPGMRERAERIGAQLHLWSHPERGTEVELAIPAQIAFESGPTPTSSNWLAKIYPRRSSADRKNRAASR